MATFKSEKYVWNSETSTWDLYYDRTSADNIEETTNYKVLTLVERTAITDYLTTFNSANKLLKLNAIGDLSIDGVTINASDFHGDIYTNYISSESDSINIGGVSKVEINAEEVIVNGTSEGIKLQGGITVDGTSEFYDSSTFDDVYINGTIGRNGDALTFGASIMNFNGAELKSVADPTDSQDAANKRWVEQLVAQGTHVIGAARAATTGNVASLSGTVTIDGVALVEGDRVLVKEQTTASQNGVYIVNSGAWTKIPNDSDKGSLITVLEGTTLKRRQYYNQNGTTWVLYWVDDDYYATVNGGLELDGTRLGFFIKESGVTNDMLAGQIDESKLANISAGQGTDLWSSTPMSRTTVSGPASTHLYRLYTGIKLLRGGTDWNDDNTQTIAGAYSKIELKNSVKYGTVVPTGNAGGADGDVFLKRLA